MSRVYDKPVYREQPLHYRQKALNAELHGTAVTKGNGYGEHETTYHPGIPPAQAAYHDPRFTKGRAGYYGGVPAYRTRARSGRRARGEGGGGGGGGGGQRPSTVPTGTGRSRVIAFGPDPNQTFNAWQMSDELAYKFSEAEDERRRTQMRVKRPSTVDIKTNPLPAYRHYKYGFLSAGQEEVEAVVGEEQEKKKWEDPEKTYLASGLGYGTTHRQHYQYRSRDQAPRIRKAVVEAEHFNKVFQHFLEEAQNDF